MTDPRKIKISDYTYLLPDDRIALHPLPQREASKLLVYRNKVFIETTFSTIDEYVEPGSLFVFNNTKVINARIRFQKPSGGIIEVFCLEPAGVITEYQTVMSATTSCRWKCFVGGASKWKEDFIERSISINKSNVVLKARIIEKLSEAYIIEFSWDPPAFHFADIIESAGDIPLPPYIKRQTSSDDKGRYQTIYALLDGSVAAPTAGLHFSESVFEKFAQKNIGIAYVTLHVGAGTFKPVKATTMQDHEMHAEWIDVSHTFIEQLANHKKKLIAVGTTSLRTLETLYWLGVKSRIDPSIKKLELNQWDAVELKLTANDISGNAALQSLLQWLKNNNQERIFTQTQLMITPGYHFRMTNALVTNFHQPQSTLLLLVAAAIGDEWKNMYQYALEHDFRFLSYGDANLIFMAES